MVNPYEDVDEEEEEYGDRTDYRGCLHEYYVIERGYQSHNGDREKTQSGGQII